MVSIQIPIFNLIGWKFAMKQADRFKWKSLQKSCGVSHETPRTTRRLHCHWFIPAAAQLRGIVIKMKVP